MADKKITALTELTSTGKVSSTDLLHIIDYSASPVNKKITVSNLLKDANTAITSFGAFTHDFGPTNAISGLSVVVPNATPAASAETEVVVNDDGNAFVDFRVQTSLNDKAFHIDSSLDSGAGNVNTITINGGATDAAKKVDFKVKSSTGILVHCDSTDHVVGIGTEAPDTAYLLDVAAVGGMSIKTAGGINVTGVSTFTGNTTITGNVTTTGVITQSGTPAATVGNAVENSATPVPLTTPISYLTANGTMFFTMAAGTQGQIKTLINTGGTGTPLAKIKGASGVNMHFGGSNTHLTLDLEEAVIMQYLNSGWAIIGMGPTASVGTS